jgi:phage terminase large subunit
VSRELNIQATPVFQKNWSATKRFVVNQGATRSSKTYSILQVLICKALMSEFPLTISIVRKTLPALKKSVLRDFIQILEGMDLYDETNHNKTDNTYELNNTIFEFFSIDNAVKYRGSKRDILFVNEANELIFEDIFQLQVRTTQQIFLDFNPSDNQSWIYSLIDDRKNEVDFIKSTYKDNTFLEESIIQEIEKLQFTDPDYWRIYGLGERGTSRDVIFQFTEVDDIPVEKAKLIGVGLDFGFTNDPTACIEVWKDENNLYLNEMMYEKGLTNDQIAQRLIEVGVTRFMDIVADSAEPKSIAELQRYALKVRPASKGPDSIANGIDILKRHRIHVTKQSTNLITELQRYKWSKDTSGNLLNRPVDLWNHAIDAVRYVALNMLKISNQGKYNISIGGAGRIFQTINT